MTREKFNTSTPEDQASFIKSCIGDKPALSGHIALPDFLIFFIFSLTGKLLHATAEDYGPGHKESLLAKFGQYEVLFFCHDDDPVIKNLVFNTLGHVAGKHN